MSNLHSRRDFGGGRSVANYPQSQACMEQHLGHITSGALRNEEKLPDTLEHSRDCEVHPDFRDQKCGNFCTLPLMEVWCSLPTMNIFTYPFI